MVLSLHRLPMAMNEGVTRAMVQGFRGCIIQTLKLKKNIKNHKKPKTPKHLNFFLKNPDFPPLILYEYIYS